MKKNSRCYRVYKKLRFNGPSGGWSQTPTRTTWTACTIHIESMTHATAITTANLAQWVEVTSTPTVGGLATCDVIV